MEKKSPISYNFFRDKNKEKNGIKVVSLFSGIGGMDLGFLEAGFDVIFASDIDKDAIDIYNKNLEPVAVDVDIKNLLNTNLLDGMNPDVIIGGFPCQGFSSAGKRNVMDPRNSLAWNMLDIIKRLKPNFIVGENVLGLRSMEHPEGGLVIEKLVEDLENIGYNIRWRVLDASEFGVPQIRKRIIIIGSKNTEVYFPDEILKPNIHINQKITINEVLNWIKGEALPENSDKFQNDDYQHYYKPLAPSDLEVVPYVPTGGNWKDVPYDKLPDRLKKIKDNIKFYKSPAFYRRANLNEVNGTLSATMNPTHCMTLHPLENRRYTIREAAYIQSFPEEFIFSSSTSKAYRQIGNAVPPLLAYQIAQVIRILALGEDFKLKSKFRKTVSLQREVKL